MTISVTCVCGEQFQVDAERQTTVCPACGKILFTQPQDPLPPPAAANPASQAPTVRAAPKGNEPKSLLPSVAAVGILFFVLIGIPAILYHLASWNGRAAVQERHQLAQHRQNTLAEIRQAEFGRHLLLAVTGPASLQSGAPNDYRIETKNLNNQPLPARLSVRVVDDADNVVHQEDDIDSAGVHRLALPRTFPKSREQRPLFLEVRARPADTHVTSSWLRERLALDSPVYTTHLATDKPMYQPGEVVSFRSLTLERFSLQPPREDLRLIYTLTNSQGEKIHELEGTTRLQDRRPGPVLGPDRQPMRGLGAGEYAIPANARGGEYTLTVSEAGRRFPPQKRSFLVNQYEKPRLHKELEWARRSYGSGERAVALCRVARVEGGLPLVNHPVTATITIDGKRYKHDGSEGDDAPPTARTDETGAATLAFTLPTHIERGDATLSIRFSDGGNVETLVRPIPLVVKKLLVDFFPEGGDLVADVPNRVYFQARTLLDKPAEFMGRIVDTAGQTVAEIKTLSDDQAPQFNQGLGCFRFTPRRGEKYALKIDTPARIAGSMPLPEVKEGGVVLSVPQGVTSGQEPIQAVVHSAGRERRLLVAVYARGRLIDHAEVKASADTEIPVRLLPAGSDIGGVFRVTVFACDPDAPPRPVAERLVYRQPVRRLNLALHPDSLRHIPGDKVQLAVSATTEKGEPAPAVLMLAVVDQRVLALADEKTARALPTHFLLTTEVRRAEDLEFADFLLGAHPRAAEALDLLLGSQGWRRFAEQNPEQFREHHQDEADRLLACNGQAPVLTSNAREVDLACQNVLQQKLAAAHSEFKEQERKIAQQEADAIRRQHHMTEFMGNAIVVLLGLAMLGSFIFVILSALVEAANRAPVSTSPNPASNLVTLTGVFSLLVILGLASISTLGSNASGKFNTVAQSIGGASGEDVAFKSSASQDKGRRDKPASALKDEAVAEAATAFDPLLLAPALAAVDQPDDGVRVGKPRAPRNRESLRLVGDSARARFEEAAREQQRRQSRAGQALPPVPGRHFLREDEQDPLSGEPLVVREYAHQRSPASQGVRSDFTETLYWHPVLVLPDGSTSVSFDLCDSVTRFQVTACGHSLDGRLGAASSFFESRLPFSIEPKLPIEVTSSDRLEVPVTIANDTDAPRRVLLRMQRSGLGLTQGSDINELTLSANQRVRQLIRLQPTLHNGDARLQIDGDSQPFAADSILRTLKVVPDGFPVAGSISDVLNKEVAHEVVLPEHWFPGTLQLDVTCYPSLLSDLQMGLEGLLREPFG